MEKVMHPEDSWLILLPPSAMLNQLTRCILHVSLKCCVNVSSMYDFCISTQHVLDSTWINMQCTNMFPFHVNRGFFPSRWHHPPVSDSSFRTRLGRAWDLLSKGLRYSLSIHVYLPTKLYLTKKYNKDYGAWCYKACVKRNYGNVHTEDADSHV